MHRPIGGLPCNRLDGHFSNIKLCKNVAGALKRRLRTIYPPAHFGLSKIISAQRVGPPLYHVTAQSLLSQGGARAGYNFKPRTTPPRMHNRTTKNTQKWAQQASDQTKTKGMANGTPSRSFGCWIDAGALPPPTSFRPSPKPPPAWHSNKTKSSCQLMPI